MSLSFSLIFILDRFEILKKSCTSNYCKDNLDGFKILEPEYTPPTEPKYTCVDSVCIDQSLQPNGNQYCTINYEDFELAQSLCKFNNCDTMIRYMHNNKCKLCFNTFINNF